MSTVFGANNLDAVTLNTDQTITGRKRFLNEGNEIEGTLNQPIILADAETIDSTEISFLAGATSNLQDQFDNINIVLGGLTALEQALQAIEPAPNATTVQFNNSILLQDPSFLTEGLTLNPTSITSLTSLDLITDPTTGSAVTLHPSAGLADINLLAFNLNSYGFALPICFDFIEVDRSYNYTSGGQNWEMIWQQDLYLPSQFFTEAPVSGYTSRKWRIDFTINTWNAGGNNNSDKALAYYIILEDQASQLYTPVLITPQTPFCRHNNNSTWTGAGSLSEFQPFSWTDLVDLQGISGSFSSLLPLRFKVYFAADNPKNFQFSYKLGLTKTNNIV